MPDAGAITLGDCHRQGRIMIEITCNTCWRYRRIGLDKLIYMHGADCDLSSVAALATPDCPKRQPASDAPCGARCA
jgi:hypothetical protein